MCSNIIKNREEVKEKEEQCERKCVKICLGLNQNNAGVWKSLVQLIW